MAFENIEDLVKKVGEDIKELVRIMEEDKETNRIYLTEIIRLLTEDAKLIKLVPIELEIHNFRNHRQEYFGKQEALLDGITKNYQIISEYFEKK